MVLRTKFPGERPTRPIFAASAPKRPPETATPKKIPGRIYREPHHLGPSRAPMRRGPPVEPSELGEVTPAQEARAQEDEVREPLDPGVIVPAAEPTSAEGVIVPAAEPTSAEEVEGAVSNPHESHGMVEAPTGDQGASTDPDLHPELAKALADDTEVTTVGVGGDELEDEDQPKEP